MTAAPGPWWELRVPLTRAALEPVSELLFEHGCGGLQEDDPPGEARAPRQLWEGEPDPPTPRLLLRAWFQEPDRTTLGRLLAPHLEEGAAPEWSPVPDQDWGQSWRAEHAPVVVSPTLTVAPPWDAPPGALLIEPGLGFGTAAHPTTRLALRELEALAPACRTLLDVGSGSGILSLAAARLGLQAEGIEIDPAAVESARQNALLNGLTVPFSTRPLAEMEGTWDLVLANIHAEVLVTLAPDLIRVTGRWLVASGILPAREADVRAAFAGLKVEAHSQEGNWMALRLARA